MLKLIKGVLQVVVSCFQERIVRRSNSESLAAGSMFRDTELGVRQLMNYTYLKMHFGLVLRVINEDYTPNLVV